MAYERPILSRYTDPLELVWMATAKRLGLTPIRRNPAIFSMTDGTGRLELGPRESLDADDTAGQQIFHEICHWITNGEASFHERDWGFPLSDEVDPREYACLRLQAHLSGRYGLRGMFGPTGVYREYYDALPEDVLTPMDASEAEAEVVRIAAEALARAEGAPWKEPVSAALEATRRLREVVGGFLPDHQTDVPDDDLPSLWSR